MIEIEQYTTLITEKLSKYQHSELVQDSFILGYMEGKNPDRTFENFFKQLNIIEGLRDFVSNQFYTSNTITKLYNQVLGQNADFFLLCAQLEVDAFDKEINDEPQAIHPYTLLKFKQKQVNQNQNEPYSIIQNQYPLQIGQPANNIYFKKFNEQQLQQRNQIPQRLKLFEESQINPNILKQYQELKASQSKDCIELQQKVEFESHIRSIEQDQNSKKLALYLQEQFDSEAKQIEKRIEDEEINIKISCQICLEVIPLVEMATLNCTHIYHIKCLNQYCKTQIQVQSFPIECPNIECKKNMKYQDLSEVLDDLTLNEYQNLAFKTYIENHSEEYSWCPTPDCSYIFIAGGFNQLDCPICKESYCLNCKINFHVGLSCKQYVEKINNEKRANDQQILDDQFLGFAKGAKFKQCPQCKFWVEKNQGCDHMTCRCKFQFCYVCGGIFQQCACLQKSIMIYQNPQI